MEKKSKIVVTIGPSSADRETIRRLYEHGMNVARLNCSHGNHEYLADLISTIRSVSPHIAILLDTKGPEIRIGSVGGNGVTIEENSEVTFTNQDLTGSTDTITLNYEHIGKIEAGNHILVDDGMLEFEVLDSGEGSVRARALNGGVINSYKGVSIHGHNVEMPFLTKKDREDLEFAIEHEVDFIAASFVRSREDVAELRGLLQEEGGSIQVIAKIEHEQAVENMLEIIKTSDGIMIARGDLGLELSLEQVPYTQQKLIRACNELGRPVIVATQMLESMRESPRPTRAEVSDVAQAIMQGADALMLSAETATGDHPVRAVRTMARIACEYDGHVTNNLGEDEEQEEFEKNAITLFVTRAAYLASCNLNTKAILTPTESGYTARKVARFRPQSSILAITRHMSTVRHLQVSWGVTALYDDVVHHDVEHYIKCLVMFAYEKGYLWEQDHVVVTAGYTLHKTGTTNLLEVYRVCDVIERLKQQGYLSD